MLYKILFFSLSVALVQGESSDISQCSSSDDGALPINAYIHGCVTPPCILPQLDDVVVDVIFRAPRDIRRMETRATAYLRIGPVTLPVPYGLGDHAETCKFLTNSYCPLLQGEVVIYQLRMLIEATFPVGTNADIEFRVVDDEGPIFCMRIAISIVPPVQNKLIN